MTNKNKRSRSKEEKAAIEEKRPALQQQALPAKTDEDAAEIKPGIFTKGQFGSLILLSMGALRMMLVGDAIRGEGAEPSRVCLQYMSDDTACGDDGVNAFLRFKFQMSIQVFLAVLALILQCWRSEDVLRRYMATLVFSPIMTMVFAFVMNEEVLEKGVLKQQVLLAAALSMVAFPDRAHIPFLTGERYFAISLQSFALMTLGCVNLYDIFNWTRQLMGAGAAGMAQELLSPTVLSTMTTPDVPALATLTYFFLVDKLALLGALFFACYYLKEQHQRVSCSSGVRRRTFYQHLLTLYALSDVFAHALGDQIHGGLLSGASLGGKPRFFTDNERNRRGFVGAPLRRGLDSAQPFHERESRIMEYNWLLILTSATTATKLLC